MFTIFEIKEISTQHISGLLCPLVWIISIVLKSWIKKKKTSLHHILYLAVTITYFWKNISLHAAIKYIQTQIV